MNSDTNIDTPSDRTQPMTREFTEAMQPADILAQSGFFADLTPRQLERVAAISAVQDCAQGQQVYRIADPANLVYVLLHGTVRHSIGFGGRHAGVGDILRRGEVFGWAALTPSCPVRLANASCLSPCRFLVIDGARLIALMEQDHTLGYRLMTQLNRLITGTLTAFAGG